MIRRHDSTLRHLGYAAASAAALILASCGGGGGPSPSAPPIGDTPPPPPSSHIATFSGVTVAGWAACELSLIGAEGNVLATSASDISGHFRFNVEIAGDATAPTGMARVIAGNCAYEDEYTGDTVAGAGLSALLELPVPFDGSSTELVVSPLTRLADPDSNAMPGDVDFDLYDTRLSTLSAQLLPNGESLGSLVPTIAVNAPAADGNAAERAHGLALAAVSAMGELDTALGKLAFEGETLDPASRMALLDAAGMFELSGRNASGEPATVALAALMGERVASNRAPELVAPPTLAAEADTDFALDLSEVFKDADGDVLALRVVGLPSGASLNGTALSGRLPKGRHPLLVSAFDSRGGGASVKATLIITEPGESPPPPPQPNKAPVAAVAGSLNRAGAAPLTTRFDAGPSSDADGEIVSYAWTLGDRREVEGEAVEVTYATPGTYAVTLTVTDDDGATDTTGLSVVVGQPSVAPNVAPVARMNTTIRSGTTPFATYFNAGGSTDEDGEIVSYIWDLGPLGTRDTKAFNITVEEPGEYDISLTVTDDDGATDTVVGMMSVEPAPSTIAMPVEVFAGSGTAVESRSFRLADASAVNRIQLTCHRCGWRGRVEDKDRPAKASLRINGGSWRDITDSGVTMEDAAEAYGGFDGGFRTVSFAMSVPNFVSGENTVDFRFNGTDGHTNGFRIIALNVLDTAGRRQLGGDVFAWDKPTEWTPALSANSDIAAGRNLWNGSKPLVESPLSVETLRASCADCHASDGRDLKYFNYSDASIIARSRFHSLSEREGLQIASYIRSLPVPVTERARPWNPPYQPGPGLDARPVEEWAAGAGLDAVLGSDGEMLPFLFPDGTSESATRAVMDANGMLNIRELPISIQLPDWNEWLPESHPKDVFPDNWDGNTPQTAYLELREQLASERDTLLADGRKLEGRLNTFMKGAITFISKDATDGRWQWRIRTSPQLDQRDPEYTVARAKENMAKWIGVKSWEIMQDFALEDVAPQMYSKGEVRAWPVGTRSVFNAAPHIVANNKNNFPDQTGLLGDYWSTAWYQLQITLNAGQGIGRDEHPVDWPYNQLHVRELSERSGRWEPFRMTATNIKAMQQSVNTTHPGPVRRGFETRRANPLWMFSNPNGDTRLFDHLETVQTGLRLRMLESYVDEWLDVHDTYEDSQYVICAEGASSVSRWACLDGKDYTPEAYFGEGYTGQTFHWEANNYYGPDKIFFWPENRHADNFYRLAPLMRDEGMDTDTLNRLIDWCAERWPLGDWASR